jgi:sterol desaturase/sphingolipid hydroxylase (fatty acid hydroxylase superfamily)
MEHFELNALLSDGLQVISSLPPSQMITLMAIPIILILAFLEYLHFRRDNKFGLKDTIASVFMGGGYVLLSEGIVVFAIVYPAFQWVYQYRLLTIDITPTSFVALFLLVDLLFYLFHLAAHKIRFLWGVHEVHHASEYFNFTVAFRQSILYAFIGVYSFFIPAVLIGFPPEWVLGALAANLIYQIFPHTQWIDKFPKAIEWLFNTPSNHRVHHGRNDRYVDRNMGGVFMVWDHIFGTYVAEDPMEAPEYGVASQKGQAPNYNPVTLTLREYKCMIRDFFRPGPLSHRLKHLWGPPEWTRPEPTEKSSSTGLLANITEGYSQVS